MLYFVLGFLFGLGFLLTAYLAMKVKYDLLQNQHKTILKNNLLLNKFLQTSFEKATKNHVSAHGPPYQLALFYNTGMVKTQR